MAIMELKACWENDYLLGWNQAEGLSRARSGQYVVMQEVGSVVDVRRRYQKERRQGPGQAALSSGGSWGILPGTLKTEL